MIAGIVIPVILQAQIHVLTLQPGPSDGIDAEIRTDRPDTPDGSTHDFIANAWTAQGFYFVQRSLIRFDLSQIPANSTVISASLFLCTNLNTGHYQLDSGANASYLLRVLEPWIEQQVTWETQPAASFENPVVLPQSVSHTQNYELDVTSHVQDMVSTPATNFGWMFRLQTEEKYRCLVFASSDNSVESWRPKLVVTFIGCIPPVANFTYETDALTVRFTDQSTSADFWEWDFGDGGTSSLQNPSYTFSAPGEYNVCLSIRDSCGISSFCDTIPVICQAPVAGYSYEITNFTTVSFTDTSRSANPSSWFWDFGDGTTSIEQNPVHDYQNTGIYNACLQISDPCGSDLHCEQIYCLLPMQVIFSTTQSTVNNLLVEFYDQTVGATNWIWAFGDGDSSLLQNPTHVYKDYQKYQVCHTAGNDSMKSTVCDSITVLKLDPENMLNRVILYPNPTPNAAFFLIFHSDFLSADILISDSKGSIILENQITDIKKDCPVEIKLNEPEPGIYLIKVSVHQNIHTLKVVFL